MRRIKNWINRNSVITYPVAAVLAVITSPLWIPFVALYTFGYFFLFASGVVD